MDVKGETPGMEGKPGVILLFQLPQVGKGMLQGTRAPCHASGASAQSRLAVVELRKTAASRKKELEYTQIDTRWQILVDEGHAGQRITHKDYNLQQTSGVMCQVLE